MGSLVTAVASYCDARSCGGEWLLRIDDIDPPREQPGAAQTIISSLTTHGFIWDADVIFQSSRQHQYQMAFDNLNAQSLLYGCQCTRKMLANINGYPGTCRDLGLSLDDHACRCRGTRDDVVVRRRDGLFSYTLCTVVDDIHDSITHVIRGMDLLHAEPLQTDLFRCLTAEPPKWHYTELVTNDQQQKLSKQNLAPALDNDSALQNLVHAWTLLKQPIPAHLASINDFWEHAIQHWAPEAALHASRAGRGSA